MHTFRWELDFFIPFLVAFWSRLADRDTSSLTFIFIFQWRKAICFTRIKLIISSQIYFYSSYLFGFKNFLFELSQISVFKSLNKNSLPLFYFFPQTTVLDANFDVVVIISGAYFSSVGNTWDQTRQFLRKFSKSISVHSWVQNTPV